MFASRNIVVLAKLESVVGTYTAPNTGADAILIGSDVSVRHNIGKLDRDNLREFMGGADSLNGFVYDEITFSTELQSSGTAGTPPAWGPLLQAAGFAETVVAATLVHYTPVSESMKALSMSCFYGGVRLNLRGCRVKSLVISAAVNTVPKITWTIIGVRRASPDDGLVVGDPSSVVLTSWKQPRAVLNETGAQNVYTGQTYNLATGGLSGGDPYPSKGMTITINNDVTARPFLGWGGDHCPIIDRDIKATISFDLDATTRAAFHAACMANTYQSLAQQLGGTTYPGYSVKFFMPRTGLMDPTNDDDAGLLLSGYTFNVLPNAGSDDIYITAM